MHVGQRIADFLNSPTQVLDRSPIDLTIEERFGFH